MIAKVLYPLFDILKGSFKLTRFPLAQAREINNPFIYEGRTRHMLAVLPRS